MGALSTRKNRWICYGILLGLVTSLVPAVPSSASTATGGTYGARPLRDRVTDAAAHYGRSRGYHVGVAVMDRETGQVYEAGSSHGTFASESVIKAFIATRLLVSGQMYGQTEAMAWKMITQSDDGMASALYGRVGGDSLILWAKRHYHVPDLGSPPVRAGWWGTTHITPDGLVRAYAKIAHDRKVAPWLLNAMHHARHYGSDGTYQFFGLASASRHAAVKQGWGCDYSGSCAEADFNSTGFVNADRYAVALLARGPISTYGKPISDMLTGMARTLLPHGTFPAPAPTLVHIGRALASVRGGAVINLRGRNFVRVRSVRFGRVRARIVRAVSTRLLRVQIPQHVAGVVPIYVTTAYGVSRPTPATRIRFVPAPTVTALSRHLLAAAGGTRVTVRGRDFRAVRAVRIGGRPVERLTVVSPWRLRAVAPTHAPGDARVVVVTRFGRSSPSAAPVQFVPAPTVTAINPSTGPQSGATVVISGADFRHVSAVKFGTASGVGLRVRSSTKLTVTAPKRNPGSVAVRVVGEFGRSNPVSYSYVGPPRITTSALPDGITGHAYAARLTTADNRQGTWAKTSGSLPSGLSLSNDTISGTPDKAGHYGFTVTFTDTWGQRDKKDLSITVGASNEGFATPTARVTMTRTRHRFAGRAR